MSSWRKRVRKRGWNVIAGRVPGEGSGDPVPEEEDDDEDEDQGD
jgi:hypothetical protein